MAGIGDIMSIGGGIVMTGVKVLFGLILMVALFFGTRKIQALRVSKKNFKITALISNPDGSHYVDKIGKFKDKDGIEKMKFQRMKLDTCPVINPKYIVNASVHLFRYGPGEFAIIPPETYRNLNIEKFDIKLINQNMLAFKGMEQRAAISRWQTRKDKLQQLMPWITIVICVVCALGAIYLGAQYFTQNIDKSVAARTQECSQILSTETMAETIVEAINKNYMTETNVTTPI